MFNYSLKVLKSWLDLVIGVVRMYFLDNDPNQLHANVHIGLLLFLKTNKIIPISFHRPTQVVWMSWINLRDKYVISLAYVAKSLLTLLFLKCGNYCYITALVGIFLIMSGHSLYILREHNQSTLHSTFKRSLLKV